MNAISYPPRFLDQVRSIVYDNLENPNFSTKEIAKSLYLSESQTYKKIKAKSKQSPSVFIRNIRLEKAKYLLENTDLNLTEITSYIGFNSLAYFSRSFSERYKRSPSEWRAIMEV